MRAVALLAALLGAAAPSPSPSSPRTCEPLRVQMCEGIGYNATGMPNLAGHALQADADRTVQTFSPLLQYGCSSQLHLFLCSVYVPMCTEKAPAPIGPCRGLCESVRDRCYPVLDGFGFPWPDEFDCAAFPPENDHEHMCMEGPGEADREGAPAPPAAPLPDPDDPRRPASGSGSGSGSGSEASRACDAEALHGAADRRLAEVWLSIWAALAFASTLAAVATAAVAAARGAGVPPAERPLAAAALCHNLAAVGWGVRAAAGHSAVACARDALAPSRFLLARDGLANPNCAVVFLLLYYFGMAACLWWVVLCGTWRARVMRRAAGIAVNKKGPPFQLVAWGLPALQTVAVLVMRDVDADELTGTCFVGNQSTRSLMVLVIVPQLVYTLVGCCFLVLGFRTLVSPPRHVAVPTAVQAQQPHARKDPAEDVNLLRLGIFAVIYVVPMSYIIGSWIYEYLYRDSWLAAAKPSPVPSVAPRPALWVFLVRILMLQLLGILTSFWVMSPRALQSWKDLFKRMGPPVYKQAPVKCVQPQIPIQYYAPQQVHSLPKRTHSHSKYPMHTHNYHRKPRLHHHSHHIHLPGGETML